MCVSHVAALISGGPEPWRAVASCTPSREVTNRMSRPAVMAAMLLRPAYPSLQSGHPLDAFGARLAFQREPPGAGEPHAFIGQHVGDERLDALVVGALPCERAGIEQQERLADARPVALVIE